MDTLADPAAWRALFEANPALWAGLAAAVGAAMASFGGVVVHRLPRLIGWIPPSAEDGGEGQCGTCGAPERVACGRPGGGVLAGLAARSRCDSCGVPIPAAALVPVLGWILRRGRCGACGGRVPRAYPVVEAATAAASAAFALHLGPTAEGAWALGALWTCVVLAWLDWRECLLPDAVTVPFLLAGLLASPFEPEALLRIQGLAAALAALWASFRAVGILKGVDAMSLGDLMLAAACGAWIGLPSVPAFLALAAAAYMAYALPLRLRGRVWVPMGPALCAGLLACLWLGDTLAPGTVPS